MAARKTCDEYLSSVLNAKPSELYISDNNLCSKCGFTEGEHIDYSQDYEKKIRERTQNFLNYLNNKYGNTNKNILLVSHKGTINALRKEKYLKTHYDIGEITELFNVSI